MNLEASFDRLKLLEVFRAQELKPRAFEKKFNLSNGTIGKLKKREVHLRSSSHQALRTRMAKWPRAILTWVSQRLKWRGYRIQPLMIRQKAKDFAKIMGITDFSSSNGWYDGFRKRRRAKLVYVPLHGERNSADFEAATNYLKHFKEMLKKEGSHCRDCTMPTKHSCS